MPVSWLFPREYILRWWTVSFIEIYNNLFNITTHSVRSYQHEVNKYCCYPYNKFQRLDMFFFVDSISWLPFFA